jgi:hypothetical protein
MDWRHLSGRLLSLALKTIVAGMAQLVELIIIISLLVQSFGHIISIKRLIHQHLKTCTP